MSTEIRHEILTDMMGAAAGIRYPNKLVSRYGDDPMGRDDVTIFIKMVHRGSENEPGFKIINGRGTIKSAKTISKFAQNLVNTIDMSPNVTVVTTKNGKMKEKTYYKLQK